MIKNFFCIFVVVNLFFNSSFEKNIQVKLNAEFTESFSEDDEFSFIGEMKIQEDVYLFLQNNRELDNGHMAWKLVVMKNNNIEGFYTQIQGIPEVCENCLIFDFPEEYGNKIDFSNGIPETVYLDGESFNFKRLN